MRGLGILIGIGLVFGFLCRVVAFAWGFVAAVWEFLVVKGFMVLLALVAGVAVLATPVADWFCNWFFYSIQICWCIE